jgi:hypothetical protein
MRCESTSNIVKAKESLSAASDDGRVGDRLVPTRFVREFVQERAQI